MSGPMLRLRGYQEEAIQAVMSAWTRSTAVRRPAILLPTGSGKTVIFAGMVRQWYASHGATRGKVVILVHRDELVRQAVNKLHDAAPTLTIGVVKGQRNEVDADVIVASVQSLRSASRLDPLVGLVGLVIVDECHHSTSTSYRIIMEALGCYAPNASDPGALALGVTATMTRADSGPLGEVWQEISYTKDILDMIAMGYLTDVEGRMVTIDGMSLAEVKTSRGDYQAASLAEVMKSSGAITATADAYLEHAKGRKTILFAPTVESAELFTLAFQERGVRAATVWGAMPEELRRSTLDAYEAGDIEVLSNVMVLTEGFDSPATSCVIIARPTKSAGLYIQMAGRCLRPHPSKVGPWEKALLLDVVGASQEHALATIADLSTRRIPAPGPGESLAEAAQREISTGALDLSGDVSVDEVDLFHRSKSVWLQTREGCWFIPAGESLVFIWPGESGLQVTRANAKARGAETLHRDIVSMDAARAWAEQEAEALNAATHSSRNASWRKKRAAATDAQKDLATRLGLEFAGDITKQDISELMDVHFASIRLDPVFRTLKPPEPTPEEVDAEIHSMTGVYPTAATRR